MDKLETKLQAEVLTYVLGNLPVVKKAEIWSFSLAGSTSSYRVAAAPLEEYPTLHVVFTLGTASHFVFMTVSDGVPSEIAGLMAQLEDFDATTASLGINIPFRCRRRMLSSMDDARR